MPKVHITLREAVRADPDSKSAALHKIVGVVKLSNLNQKRFERHGIISGDTSLEAALDAVEKMSEVKSVAVDSEQRAIGAH